MALDPRVLAALSAGAKTSGSFDPTAITSTASDKPGAWNLGQGIIDILSTGGYATAGLTQRIGQGVAEAQRGDIGASIASLNPFGLAAGVAEGVASRRTYSDNLKDIGVNDTTATWLGLALDIGLDPTTYITGGTIAGIKAAGKGAKVAGEASKAGKLAAGKAPTADIVSTLAGGTLRGGLAGAKPAGSFLPIGRELTQNEKLGNLLSGIGQGYKTGKSTYKLSIKQNKLTRVSRKQAKKLDTVRGIVETDSTFIAAKTAKAAEKVEKAATKAAEGMPEIIDFRVVKLPNGKFSVEIFNAQGIITDWSKAGKEYSAKGSATKAAKAGRKEVEDAINAGKTPTIQTNPTSGMSADEIAVGATRAAEESADAVREREVLAEASGKQSALNKLAQTLSRPTAVRAVRDIDRTVESLREQVKAAKGDAKVRLEESLSKAEAELSRYEDLKTSFLDRIDTFRDAEEATITAAKVEKVTVEDIVKYINQPTKTAKANPVIDGLLETSVDVPENARALRKALADQGVDPDDVQLQDLIYAIEDATMSPATTAKATAIVDAAIAGAAKGVGLASPELMPWTDGVITPEDAGEAIRELVNFVYADLKKNTLAYKAIVKALEDAYFNRLKAVAGESNRPLTADEVEAVFESFLSGTDISKALDKVGAVDLEKIDPGTYDDMAEMARDLQEGKLTLSTIQKQDLAEILGVPKDSVEAAIAKLADNVNGVSHLLDEEAAAAAELSKTPVGAADAITATGNSAGADVAEATARSFTPEAEAAHIAMREEFSRDLVSDIAKLSELRGESATAASQRIKEIIRENLTSAMLRQVKEAATKAGKEVDDYIDDVLAARIPFLVEDFEKVTDTGAIKIDEFGTGSRADIHNAVEDAKYYRQNLEEYATPEKIETLAKREAYMELAVENLLRSMGFVVRSTENKASRLARRAKKEEYSSVTHADIMSLLVDLNRTDLFAQLRKPRGKYTPYKEGGIGHGNFLPTDIEDAWLAVQRLKENGSDIARGSDDFLEVRRALETSYTVGGKAARDAQHVVTANTLKGDDAAEIFAAGDELIQILVDNYDTLKAIHVRREKFVASVVARNVWNPASELYLGMIKFAREYRGVKEAHKAGDISAAQVEEDLGALVYKYDAFLNQISTGSFGDKELAAATANIIKNAFMAGKFAPKGAEQVLLNPVVKQLEDSLRMVRAMDGAGDDVGETLNARRKQKEKTIDDDVTIASEQIAKGVQAGNAPPLATEAADLSVAEVVMANGAFAKAQTWWSKVNKALNGNAVMGGALKTIIASSEQSAISYSHYFALGLRAVRDAARGQEGAMREAFVALREYRKEVDALIEAGDDIIEIEDFLAAYGKTVDRGFFDLLDESFTMLLGNNNVFGAAKGIGIMKDELNRSLRQLGLTDIQVGDEAIESFWHKYDPDKFPDQSPLEFLNLLNLAVHRAASRVEIASQLDYFVAKTPEQIKELGENIGDYVKIDPSTNFGQLLGDTGKFIHKDEVEKVKAMWQYMESDSKFSDGALRRIVEVSDRITYVLKSTNTLIRPGHHVVSIVGEFAMNTLAGVRISSYNNTARILNRFRPGQYENADEPFKAYANLTAVKGKQIKASEFDTVYWIKTVNGKQVKEVIPDELVYDLAERYGVLVHPGGSLEDFIVTGEAIIKGGYAKFHQGMNKIAVFASHRDNFFRLTHFIDELQKTAGAKGIEEAAAAAATAIREWHPTAGSLSAFEKKYMRRLVYFYTWQRVALTKVIATMLERPGIATIPSKIQYAFSDANGFNPESFGDPWDNDGIYASWYTGSVFGPQFQGPAGEGDAWGVQPAFQPIDILGQMFKPFTLQPGQSPIDSMAQGVNDLFGSNLNPLLKTLIESSAQSRLGEGGDLPSPTEYLINQVGFLNTISKVSGVGQDPNPYETPQEKKEKDLRLWLNLILGQRVTDYSTPASQYRWTVDQQETARRLAGQ